MQGGPAGISATRLFDIGLRAARENPGLCRTVYTSRDRYTNSTSIDISPTEFYYMMLLGLRVRETIQLGIDQVRQPAKS